MWDLGNRIVDNLLIKGFNDFLETNFVEVSVVLIAVCAGFLVEDRLLVDVAVRLLKKTQLVLQLLRLWLDPHQWRGHADFLSRLRIYRVFDLDRGAKEEPDAVLVVKLEVKVHLLNLHIAG